MAVAITWIDPDGNLFPLDVDASRLVLPGMSGHRAPPVVFAEEQTFSLPGGVVRSVRDGVREVTIPLLSWGPIGDDLDNAMAELSSALDPSRGVGQLRFERDDGSFRVLFCRYAGGLEGTQDDPGHESAVLVFRAHDPYWVDLVATEVIIAQSPAGAFFPFFPFEVTASELYAIQPLDVEGDVEVWPIWTIAGPGDGPVVRDLVSGQVTDLPGISLDVGDVLVVDTRPGEKSVRLNGASVFGAMTAASSLWSIGIGSQSVRVELSAATEDTEVSLAYRHRYRGA